MFGDVEDDGSGGELAAPGSTEDSLRDRLPIDTTAGYVDGENETHDQSIDLWNLEALLPAENDPHLTWDGFEDDAPAQPVSAYVTEARPALLDAILADESDLLNGRSNRHLVLDSRLLISSLLALGLGRSSRLFVWDEVKKQFQRTHGPFRISGCTGETVHSVTTVFMNCGNMTRTLQYFVEKTYRHGRSNGRIAFAEAASTLLTTLQVRLDIPLTSIRSYLQLEALFQPAEALLNVFVQLMKIVTVADSDEAMLSRILFEVQRQEHKTDSMREVLLEVLSRVSRPFLGLVEEWMGLQEGSGLPMEKTGIGRSFVKVEDKVWVDEQGIEIQKPDFTLDLTHVPDFIQPEDARRIFETGKSLRFIRSYHSSHPLARRDVVTTARPPRLDWRFSWQDVQRLESRALQYQQDLVYALNRFSISPLEQAPSASQAADSGMNQGYSHVLEKSEEDLEAYFSDYMASLNQPLPRHNASDSLSWILDKALSGDRLTDTTEEAIFAPPITLVPSLSFGPLIAAQAKVVNIMSMRLIFSEHNLLEHLRVQRRFNLLGDGVFSSRLSHALFDPDLDTAERKDRLSRPGGVMGLRLEGRDSWPPASSELRLALMGVLTESYASTAAGPNPMHPGDRKFELPGDLSFAVRDMTDEEIERCKDPHSVEALDFLRLSYKPPSPLDAIITPLSLYKYDQLFKLLLRVFRMLFVVNQLFCDSRHRNSKQPNKDATSQRFCIEAHHFVSCISSYFFDAGIEATWRIFERKLDQVAEHISKPIDEVALGQDEGLDNLREYHEKVLDRIMFTLLLRKRQQPVMKLLEDIFTIILGFASRSRKTDSTTENEVGDMYRRFQRKVKTFLTVCRGLSEKRGYGERAETEARAVDAGGLFDADELAEENTVAQLVARFEMSDYYLETRTKAVTQ